MNGEQYILAIEKFIEGIILDDFPEIWKFDVQGDIDSVEKIIYVSIIFYTEGRRQSWFHNKLHHAIGQMKTYLSIPEFVIISWSIETS